MDLWLLSGEKSEEEQNHMGQPRGESIEIGQEAGEDSGEASVLCKRTSRKAKPETGRRTK